MAINPLITMGVKPINLDFSDRRLRNAHSDLYEQQADVQRQNIEQEKSTMEALKQFGNDITPETIKQVSLRDPKTGMVMQNLYSKQQADAIAAQEAGFKAQEAQYKAKSADYKMKSEQLAKWANLAAGITDEQSYYQALKFGVDEGLDVSLVRGMAEGGYDPVKVQQFAKRMLTAKERVELDDLLDKKEFEAKKRPQELKKLENEVANTTRNAQGLLPSEVVTANAPTAEQKNFQTFYGTWLEANGLPKNAKNEMAARKAYQESQRTPVPGVDVALPTEVEEQRIRMNPRQASGTGAAGADVGDNDPMLKAILANPLAFDSLTLKQKERLIPALQRNGFDQFGKPLSGGEVKDLADSRSVIAGLQDLRGTLKQYEQFIGPVSGLAALNPYSDAVKADSAIKLVTQRVGKILEGGVLRKEDEIKYKKILADLRDTPETAIFKVDNIIATIERDMQIYRDELRASGRRMPAEKKPTGERPPLSSFEVNK
jgi:hypothetical protein